MAITDNGMAVMFSNSKSSIPTNGHIIEFKAGRTVLEPGSAESKKRVVPENKKGLVYVKQSNDQLIHFCWKDRETGALVDDLIIFPGDTDFKEVKECVDGKVYMLKFKTSKDMRLYWLQEGGSEIEKDLVQKVTDALNKPPPTRTPARGGASERLINFPSGLNVGSDDFSGALGNLDHQQLLSLLQTFGGNGVDVSLTGDATTGEAQAETSSTPQPDGQAVKLQNDLSKILSNLNKTPKKQALASLADAIANTTVQETSKNHGDRLKPLIATTENPADTELEETLRTPQLRQAADSFGNALQTGQLGPVLEQFGVSGGVLEAANKGDLLEFAKQLTVQESGQPTQSGAPASQPPVKKESDDDESKEPEPKKSRPDLEDMDVD